jgi:hypothetical protein
MLTIKEVESAATSSDSLTSCGIETARAVYKTRDVKRSDPKARYPTGGNEYPAATRAKRVIEARTK